MSLNFVLFHNLNAAPQDLVLPEGYWHMGTCLRSIILSDHESIPYVLKGYEVLKNEKAFEFLLQIVCGLHSPLIGETEVLGQFKSFVKNYQGEFSSNLKTVVNSILKEAKAIRTHFLQNLGCTSYGSLLRKHIDSQSKTMTILGAGSLVEDILPWFLKQKTSIQVLTRSPHKHYSLKKQYPRIELLDLSQSLHVHGETLVIAAPLTSHWLKQNIDLNSYNQIFDLRGEGKIDPLKSCNCISLETLFTDIEKNRRQALQVKKSALQAIKESVVKMNHIERQRPFGWEDLWAYS